MAVNMKLGEALSALKKEKSRLARLILLRKENVYIEKGKQAKFDPKKLSEAIIKVNDMRSKISHLSKLFEKEKYYFFRDKEEKEIVSQLDEIEVEDDMERLEIEKVQLDNKIQITNWTTILVD